VTANDDRSDTKTAKRISEVQVESQSPVDKENRALKGHCFTWQMPACCSSIALPRKNPMLAGRNQETPCKGVRHLEHHGFCCHSVAEFLIVPAVRRTAKKLRMRGKPGRKDCNARPRGSLRLRRRVNRPTNESPTFLMPWRRWNALPDEAFDFRFRSRFKRYSDRLSRRLILWRVAAIFTKGAENEFESGAHASLVTSACFSGPVS
jgi:hypothetical protein